MDGGRKFTDKAVGSDSRLVCNIPICDMSKNLKITHTTRNAKKKEIVMRKIQGIGAENAYLSNRSALFDFY